MINPLSKLRDRIKHPTLPPGTIKYFKVECTLDSEGDFKIFKKMFGFNNLEVIGILRLASQQYEDTLKAGSEKKEIPEDE